MLVAPTSSLDHHDCAIKGHLLKVLTAPQIGTHTNSKTPDSKSPWVTRPPQEARQGHILRFWAHTKHMLRVKQFTVDLLPMNVSTSLFKCSFPSWAASRDNRYHMPRIRHISDLLGCIRPQKKLRVVEFHPTRGSFLQALGKAHPTDMLGWVVRSAV